MIFDEHQVRFEQQVLDPDTQLYTAFENRKLNQYLTDRIILLDFQPTSIKLHPEYQGLINSAIF